MLDRRVATRGRSARVCAACGSCIYLSSHVGQKSRETRAFSPCMCGMWVVCRAIMVDPDGLRPTWAATIMRACLSWGSSSSATEFTLSRSMRAALEIQTITHR